MNVLKDADIICFSHDWTGDPLSKTHIVRILARRNRILWVNALANRAPTASRKDLLRVLDKLKAFAVDRLSQPEPNIFVMSPLAFPSYGSETIRNINRIILQYQLKQAIKRLKFKNPINLIFNPAGGLLARKLGESLLVYYCVDEYSAFTGAVKGLKQIEEDLCKESDFVVVSAQKLLESKSKFNENTFLIKHGVDWSHFRQAINSAQLPEEIKNLPRPIIGFHGLLADWIDYELIKKIAEHFKNASIVLIGKVTIEAEALVENI
ncbi:MAG: glycosyltransferase family 1 protein, partial [Acidobacteria bacterium]